MNQHLNKQRPFASANLQQSAHQRQQGVALVAAIFLMIVLGSAVILLSTLSFRNADQTTQSLLQMRAQLAVTAAQEYAVQQLISDEGNDSGSACSSINSSSLSIDAFSEFSISVDCSADQYSGAASSIWLYNLLATAEYGNIDNPDYVWTELEFSVEF